MLTVSGRTVTTVTLKGLRKGEGIMVANEVGNLLDTLVTGGQFTFGIFHPHLSQQLLGTCVCKFLKQVINIAT